jgi:hypothetical protein
VPGVQIGGDDAKNLKMLRAMCAYGSGLTYGGAVKSSVLTELYFSVPTTVGKKFDTDPALTMPTSITI